MPPVTTAAVIPLWARVAEQIAGAIASGASPPGSQLPPEAALMRHHQVSRNTLRRAVAELEQRGLLRTEQGRGTFVEERLDYTIGGRTRLTESLARRGLEPGRLLRMIEQEPAAADVAAALQISPGEPVWRLVAVQTAGEVELNLATSWYAVARFPDFKARRRREPSVSALLRGYGITDYVRAWTRIVARRAVEAEARTLRQPLSSPVFEVQKLDADLAGRPIAYGVVIWAADRVQFWVPGVADLQPPTPAADKSTLRSSGSTLLPDPGCHLERGEGSGRHSLDPSRRSR